MKYILIPLLKIILLIILIAFVPFKILWNLIMSFKWIGWREAFRFGEDSLVDASWSDYLNVFSKGCTDRTIDEFKQN